MEAGFSNFHLWSTAGSTLTYAWSYYLCMDVKIYIMMGIVSFGVVCYLIAEVRLHMTSQGFGDRKDLDDAVEVHVGQHQQQTSDDNESVGNGFNTDEKLKSDEDIRY